MASIVPTEIDLQKDKILSALRKYTWWETIPPAILSRLAEGDLAHLARHFTTFCANEGKMFLAKRAVLSVRRPSAEELAAFIGQEGWKIVEVESDARSLAITDLSISRVHLEPVLKLGEPSILGEDRLARIKETGHIRLDLGMFLVFWNNQGIIPESWEDLADEDDGYIYFDGTVLENPHGERCVFCLHRRDGEWRWTLDWLGMDSGRGAVSAIVRVRKP